MNYNEMVAISFKERREIDEAVENIVRLNGDGALFREREPAMPIEESGDSFCLLVEDGIFASK